MRKLSRTALPWRLSVYSTCWPFHDHQADSTGGPIQSGSAIACSMVIGVGAAWALPKAVNKSRDRGRNLGIAGTGEENRASVAARTLPGLGHRSWAPGSAGELPESAMFRALRRLLRFAQASRLRCDLLPHCDIRSHPVFTNTGPE